MIVSRESIAKVRLLGIYTPFFPLSLSLYYEPSVRRRDIIASGKTKDVHFATSATGFLRPD